MLGKCLESDVLQYLLPLFTLLLKTPGNTAFQFMLKHIEKTSKQDYWCRIRGVGGARWASSPAQPRYWFALMGGPDLYYFCLRSCMFEETITAQSPPTGLLAHFRQNKESICTENSGCYKQRCFQNPPHSILSECWKFKFLQGSHY